MTPKEIRPKDDRPRIAALSEFYEDLLEVDSALTGRTTATQATSLLCAKLQEREPKIKDRVRYLAAKRGLTFEDMWLRILQGRYEKMATEEKVGLEVIEPWE